MNPFAWAPTNMPGINPNVVYHQLSIKPRVKLVAQRKRKEGEEKSLVVSKEVKKVVESESHPGNQVSNMADEYSIGKEELGKVVSVMDFNKVFPKDLYPIPKIDKLIDSVSDFRTLSFMDVYSGYNQIRMSPIGTPK